MGSKRVGLARVEAMLESLKRELDFAGSRFVAVKGVEMCAYSAEAEADGTGGFTSDAISIPANAVIVNMGMVVTSNLVLSTSMELECFFGTTNGGHELTASDPNGLMASGTGPLVAGKGTSTIAHENTILGGNATLVPEADQGYSTSARSVYGSVIPSTGNITAGKAKFWVRYILLD
tara:strand:+ start:277 stop:807 length:531 start_codon:yes stop_codon:yes gene_type:complete